MNTRRLSLTMALLMTATVVGCGEVAVVPEKRTTGSYGPDIIHFDGLRNIAFGDTEQELTRRGVLTPAEAPCGGPQLAGLPTVGPVFDDSRLVLLWVDSPLRTPEGITIGTPIEQVRTSFPDATILTAPRGTHRYDGVLAKQGDRAFLFLHDGKTVRKTIAGYADYAEKLFNEGFGTC